MSIKGKVALITGAAAGIGLGIAKRLAADGAAVALADLREDRLPEAAAGIEGRTMTLVLDVRRREDVFAAVDRVERELGGFDIMVNNAGVVQVAPISEITEEQIDAIHGVNVKGVLWGIQAAAAKFRARGHGGKIISAASISAHEGFPMFGAYATTKYAVRALTQVAAKELASYGITVNAYCPGVVATGMFDTIDARFTELTGAKKGETWAKFVDMIALGRSETPEDVARLVSYLAGPDSDYMTGQCPILDGGMVYR